MSGQPPGHTQTLRALEQFKFAIDQHAIVSIADAGGNIIYINGKFSAISQYSEQELLGRNHSIINSGYHRAEFFQGLWKTISSGKVWQGEIRNRRKDGSFYWLQTTIVPFLDEAGAPQQYVSIRTDVTERKLIEEDLLKSRDEADQANHAKSDFLSRMSHELRTPLNAIVGFGQLLESDPAEPLTESQEKSVAHIIEAGWRLSDLIDKVLELAKIEAGQIELSMENVFVSSLVSECAGLVAAMAQQRNLTLICRNGGDKHMTVYADRTRLKQVLLNLLSNAIKYNRDSGSVTIDVEHAAGRVRISVSDTGSGMSAEQQSCLFQPFVRLGAAKSSTEGTGIGLVTSKRLVELMDGSIGLKSAPGQGSTFWIDLNHRTAS